MVTRFEFSFFWSRGRGKERRTARSDRAAEAGNSALLPSKPSKNVQKVSTGKKSQECSESSKIS